MMWTGGEQEKPAERGERLGPAIPYMLPAILVPAIRKSSRAVMTPARNGLQAPREWMQRNFPRAQRKRAAVQRAFRDILRETRPAELWIRGPRPKQARKNSPQKDEAKRILRTGGRGRAC